MVSRQPNIADNIAIGKQQQTETLVFVFFTITLLCSNKTFNCNLVIQFSVL